jgi:Protein of unknown function (DUF3429)
MTKLTHSIPLAAFWLGIAVVVPFAALALQIATGWPMGARAIGPALYALTIFGAVILSFMGGAHWGVAVADTHVSTGWRRYGVAVLPALAAWGGVWIGQKNGLLLLTAAFAALLAYDLWTIRQGETPAWYGPLRIGLTVIVCASLLIAALFGPFS